MNYGWLDPKFWIRKQSKQHSYSGFLLKYHLEDDNPLVVGLDLVNFRRGGDLLKSNKLLVAADNFKEAKSN